MVQLGMFANYCDALGKRKYHKYQRPAYQPSLAERVETLVPFTDIYLLGLYVSDSKKSVLLYGDNTLADDLALYLCKKVHSREHTCNITVGKKYTLHDKEKAFSLKYNTNSTKGRMLCDAITAADLGKCVLVYPPSRHARRFSRHIKIMVPLGFVETINEEDRKSYGPDESYTVNIDKALEYGLFTETEMWLLGWPIDPEQRMHAGFPLFEKDKQEIRKRSQQRLIDLLRQRGTDGV